MHMNTHDIYWLIILFVGVVVYYVLKHARGQHAKPALVQPPDLEDPRVNEIAMG